MGYWDLKSYLVICKDAQQVTITPLFLALRPSHLSSVPSGFIISWLALRLAFSKSFLVLAGGLEGAESLRGLPRALEGPAVTKDRMCEGPGVPN